MPITSKYFKSLDASLIARIDSKIEKDKVFFFELPDDTQHMCFVNYLFSVDEMVQKLSQPIIPNF